jgi:hypothetical protein
VEFTGRQVGDPRRNFDAKRAGRMGGDQGLVDRSRAAWGSGWKEADQMNHITFSLLAAGGVMKKSRFAEADHRGIL